MTENHDFPPMHKRFWLRAKEIALARARFLQGTIAGCLLMAVVYGFMGGYFQGLFSKAPATNISNASSASAVASQQLTSTQQVNVGLNEEAAAEVFGQVLKSVLEELGAKSEGHWPGPSSTAKSSNGSMTVTASAMGYFDQHGRTRVGLPVGFIGQVQGGVSPFGYVWNFGDGRSALSASHRKAYEIAGDRTVTFSVTDSSGQVAVAQLYFGVVQGHY